MLVQPGAPRRRTTRPSDACRVMPTVAWMPAGMPSARTSAALRVMRAAYSSTARAAEDQVGVAVDEAGRDEHPGASSTRPARRIDLALRPRPACRPRRSARRRSRPRRPAMRPTRSSPARHAGEHQAAPDQDGLAEAHATRSTLGRRLLGRGAPLTGCAAPRRSTVAVLGAEGCLSGSTRAAP